MVTVSVIALAVVGVTQQPPIAWLAAILASLLVLYGLYIEWTCREHR